MTRVIKCFIASFFRRNIFHSSLFNIILGLCWPLDVHVDSDLKLDSNISKENYLNIYENKEELLREFNEEDYNTVLPESVNKYTHPADSNNELDLIDFKLELVSPPTPSSTSSTTSFIEQLFEELTNELQPNCSVAPEPTSLVFTSGPASPLEQSMNYRTLPQPSSPIMSSPVSNYERDEDRVLSSPTEIQPNKLHYWTQQNFTDELALTAVNKFLSTEQFENRDVESGEGGVNILPESRYIETDSTQASGTVQMLDFHSKSTKMTRKERNNEASKKLRLKRKRKEEDLNMQEELSKKQKLDNEREVDALKIQIAEAYKSGQMQINHFAQDNLYKYQQLLFHTIKLDQSLKQDSDYNKVFKKVLAYFGEASVQYISVEQGAEIQSNVQRFLKNHTSN